MFIYTESGTIYNKLILYRLNLKLYLKWIQTHSHIYFRNIDLTVKTVED